MTIICDDDGIMHKVFNKIEIRELICEIDKYLQSADVDLSIRTNVFDIANKFMEWARMIMMVKAISLIIGGNYGNKNNNTGTNICLSP